MNAFSKIDMREVTRLTRAGKLGEAMAMLRGRNAAEKANDNATSDAPASTRSNNPRLPALDRAGRSILARVWTTPPLSPTTQSAEPPTFKRTLDSLRGRLPVLGSPHGAVEGLGSERQRSVPARQGARFEERMFSNEAGSRTYKVYIPSGYAGQALPVVVMLHGCTQDPDDFAAGTGMNEVAEEQTFLVVYPRQPASANMKKCWNWFNAADQRREGGEPSLIAGIARQVVEEFSADPKRVYVAGLSAGGAAASIMAATYPDLFAAVGVHSGLACGAARDMASAFAAMGGGGAVRARGEGPLVPTIVFHGDADRTVNPVNGDHVVAQATRQATLTKVVTHGETLAGVGYTRTVQRDAAGAEVLEQWAVHGAGHAWFGGNSSGSFTDPRGPDASREMMRFFLQHAKR